MPEWAHVTVEEQGPEGRCAHGQSRGSEKTRVHRLACGSPYPALAHVDVLMEGVQSLRQALHGYQHVLHYVVLLIQLAQRLALGQLQEGDLGRHHPTKEVAEDRVVTKGDDVLQDSSWNGEKEPPRGECLCTRL